MEKSLIERELEAFIHSFSEGVVLTDIGRVFLLINPMAEHLLGISSETWVGRSVKDCLEERADLSWVFAQRHTAHAIPCWERMECTRADCPLHGKSLIDCWARERSMTGNDCASGTAGRVVPLGKCTQCRIFNSYVFHSEMEICRPNAETIILHAHTTPMFDEHGKIHGTIHLLRDITRDRELARLKDDFASTLSHELRSPLTSIRSYTEILMHYTDTEPETQGEFLRIIHSESERLERMIDDFMELQQLESARSVWNNKEVSLPHVVHKILKDYEGMLGRKGIRCRTHLDPKCPKVWLDPDKIYHVVGTLLRNLAGHTPPDREIEIEAIPMKGQRRSDSDLFIKCTLTNLPDVSSQGLGPEVDGGARVEEAPPVEIPRERKKGLGIGLLLSKMILDEYGGRLWLESDDARQGYTIHFAIPSSIPQRDAATEAEDGGDEIPDARILPPEILPAIDKSRKKILILDDDPRQVNSLTFALKRELYRVDSTTSPFRALEMVLEGKPDLIISDVRMPEMDGYSFFRQVQEDEATKMIPFIFISAPRAVGERIQGLKSGVDEFLEKPYDLRELLARVEAMLRREERHRDLSRLDDLTGALNRKAFDECLTWEMRKARRETVPLALAMADLDHFKRVNDTHGHPAGDFVLRSFVAFLQKNLRDEDILGRYGGEEFCIVMPGTEKKAAGETLERIRTRLSENRFSYEKGNATIAITCSFGVSVFPMDSAAGAGLIEKADAALYRAKNMGRNRVVLYQPGELPPVPDLDSEQNHD